MLGSLSVNGFLLPRLAEKMEKGTWLMGERTFFQVSMRTALGNTSL